jgi:DNA-binding winged helix-turn-helix (wHTH) protein
MSGSVATAPHAHALCFGPHRLAGPHGPLSSDGVDVRLAPKAMALLWALASQPGRVLTKAALLDAIWGDVAVGDDALGFQIQALRQALDDEARRPRYIETLHRIGYRFIAPVAMEPAGAVATGAPQPAIAGVASRPRAAHAFVGRGSELAALGDLLPRAIDGHRQVAFVTGEAGIGKSALIDAFLADRRAPARVVRGQCVDQDADAEAFHPLLDALSRVCRDRGDARLLAMLRQHETGAPRGRMMRELCEALEALAAVEPVVLQLDDLQWADPATVEWLAMMARRPEPARLLVLATYRPAEVHTHHPLTAVKRELVASGRAIELPLGPLSHAVVAAYVEQRLRGLSPDEAPAASVYGRSEGHPLFMVAVTDLMAAEPQRPGPAARGLLHAIDQTVPPRVRELVEAQLERLPAEAQRLLEAASVARAEFTPASLAAGLEMEPAPVERLCDRLARGRQFIEDRGVTLLADGTLEGCYGFRYALHRDVLAARLGPGQRARLRAGLGVSGAPARFRVSGSR